MPLLFYLNTLFFRLLISIQKLFEYYFQHLLFLRLAVWDTGKVGFPMLVPTAAAIWEAKLSYEAASQRKLCLYGIAFVTNG